MTLIALNQKKFIRPIKKLSFFETQRICRKHLYKSENILTYKDTMSQI